MNVPIIKRIPPQIIDGRTYYATSEGHILNAKGKQLVENFCPAKRNYKRGSCYPCIRIAGKDRRIHHLVCATFWGLPQPNQICHHLDGNKFNNRPDNLIWLSREDHPKFDRLTRQGIIYKHLDPDALMEYEMSHHCER